MLQRCIGALAQQGDEARFRWRLVVVDNNEHATGELAKWISQVFPRPHVVAREPRPGIPYARNRGIEAALEMEADFILFLDDDEIAPPGWMRAMFECVQASGADVVQGGVTQTACPIQLASPAPIVKAAATRAAETAATCNTIMRAWPAKPPYSLRFDENMRFTGGSDLEYFMRAHQCGARVVRAKGVDVLEQRVPERETLRYRMMRSFSSGNNYHARVAKNCRALTATRRIVFRALNRVLTGAVTLAVAPLAALISTKRGRKLLDKACSNLSFAVGCVSPAFGWRHEPYRHVVGV